MGYCQAVEKILVPSDRSIILRTAYKRGVECAVPELAPEAEVVHLAGCSRDLQMPLRCRYMKQYRACKSISRPSGWFRLSGGRG